MELFEPHNLFPFAERSSLYLELLAQNLRFHCINFISKLQFA